VTPTFKVAKILEDGAQSFHRQMELVVLGFGGLSTGLQP
jgi:hypothetical protein